MKRVLSWLDRNLEQTLMIILLVMIACVELVQVIVRNVPFIPALTWAEEFCRFCWIWSVFLSLPYTISKSSMLRVNVLMDLLPQKLHKIVNILVDAVIAGTMLLLGHHSYGVVMKIWKSGETSAAMEWPMWAVYSIMVVGFTLGGFRGIQQLVRSCRSWQEKLLSSREQTEQEAASEVRNSALQEKGE